MNIEILARTQNLNDLELFPEGFGWRIHSYVDLGSEPKCIGPIYVNDLGQGLTLIRDIIQTNKEAFHDNPMTCEHCEDPEALMKKYNAEEGIKYCPYCGNNLYWRNHFIKYERE